VLVSTQRVAQSLRLNEFTVTTTLAANDGTAACGFRTGTEAVLATLVVRLADVCFAAFHGRIGRVSGLAELVESDDSHGVGHSRNRKGPGQSDEVLLRTQCVILS